MKSDLPNFQNELTSTAEDKKLWQREKAVLAVTEMICEIMEEENISRTELAERMGVGKSNVSQLLDGTANLQLKTVADMCTALGREFIPSTKRLLERDADRAVTVSSFEVATSTDYIAWGQSTIASSLFTDATYFTQLSLAK